MVRAFLQHDKALVPSASGLIRWVGSSARHDLRTYSSPAHSSTRKVVTGGGCNGVWAEEGLSSGGARPEDEIDRHPRLKTKELKDRERSLNEVTINE